MVKAYITGLAGLALSPEEAAFLRAEPPAGIILFARNCASHQQIKQLVDDAREAIGTPETLVLIDQEGGRVQRLRPPLGRALPAAIAYATLYASEPAAALEAAFLAARLVAEDLRALGINTDCAPVLDVPVRGSHDIIGDRAYGTTPDQVAALGRVVAEGFMAGGVVPVVKHIPGHGRATADSHFDLPVVTTAHADLSRTDFASFRALSDMPTAMTAHVLFEALDAEHPASTSLTITRDIIRGEIGFDGFLMSDDLSMKALGGTMTSRAEAVIAAGSDVALHCNGNLAEMRQVAAHVPVLSGAALARYQRALNILAQNQPFDRDKALSCLARVLAIGASRIESV